MHRFLLCALPFLAVACAGHQAATAPVPEAMVLGSRAPAPADSTAVAAVTIVATDSSHSPATADPEAAAARRLAEDSAADQAILEQLEQARPAGSDSADGAEPMLPRTGGGNSLAATPVTWDIDVETYNSHDRVQYYLDFFQGPARDRMAIWLTRLPRYEALIRNRMKEHGLPSDMVYLALIESGFSSSAVSRSRAVGMWQFMKGTAKLYGLRVDRWVDERRDPYRATDAAVRYLSDLRDRFGSPYLAAAAYNAGAGKVGRGLKRLPEEEDDSLNTDASFFRLYDTRFLRRETKDYVPKLIAAALIAKEPTRYGFDRPDTTNGAYPDSVIVPDATGLDVIARLADTTLAAIRELNPQYLRLMTPPGARMVIRVPPGKGEVVAGAYAALPTKERVTFVEHFVGRGETLGSIAKRYRVSYETLVDANPGVRSRSLKVGQRLVIPSSGFSPSREVLRSVDDPAPRASRRSSSGTHRVRAGESLWTISQKYGVSITQLREWNGLGPNETLKAGRIIKVGDGGAAVSPSGAPAGTSPRAPARSSGLHVVRRGETLAALAKRFGTTVDALREANGLDDGTVLKAGATLKIPG